MPSVSRRQLDDEDLFCYLAEDGFLAYSWSGGHSEVQVYNVVAGVRADGPRAVVDHRLA